MPQRCEDTTVPLWTFIKESRPIYDSATADPAVSRKLKAYVSLSIILWQDTVWASITPLAKDRLELKEATLPMSQTVTPTPRPTPAECQGEDNKATLRSDSSPTAQKPSTPALPPGKTSPGGIGGIGPPGGGPDTKLSRSRPFKVVGCCSNYHRPYLYRPLRLHNDDILNGIY